MARVTHGYRCGICNGDDTSCSKTATVKLYMETGDAVAGSDVVSLLNAALPRTDGGHAIARFDFDSMRNVTAGADGHSSMNSSTVWPRGSQYVLVRIFELNL